MLKKEIFIGIFIMASKYSDCSNRLFTRQKLCKGLAVFLLSMQCFAGFAQIQHIQDNAKVLNSPTTLLLEKILEDFEKKNKLHIELVTVSSFHNRPVKNVAAAFAAQLVINSPFTDNCVLLLIDPQSKGIYINTSSNLNQKFTPHRIISITNKMERLLQQKNYNQAAMVGLEQIRHVYLREPFFTKQRLASLKQGITVLRL